MEESIGEGMHALFWIRMGDGADYESYSSHIEAAYAIADYFAMMDSDGERAFNIDDPDAFYWHHDGAGLVAEPHFGGNNYISAYWGDEEANLVAGLTKKEQREFKATLRKDYHPKEKSLKR